jgi:hypothetical protein
METRTYVYEDTDSGSGDEAKLTVPIYVKAPERLDLPLQPSSGSGYMEFSLVGPEDEDDE